MIYIEYIVENARRLPARPERYVRACLVLYIFKRDCTCPARRFKFGH